MINSLTLLQTGGATGQPEGNAPEGLSLADYTRYLNEVMNQPGWRITADKEMDYVDGNQLDAAIIQRMKKIGMPPAIEPVIGPKVDDVMGYEAKTRKDWRITANGQDSEADDVAEALNYELNLAERESKADKACSAAFRPQYAVGIGWVEVARESNPFLFKYRCSEVHRNEIWWDMLAKCPLLSDARYLFRRKWTDVDQACQKFPDKAELITAVGAGMGWADRMGLTMDGGTTPSLMNAWASERGWSVEEQEWRDSINRRVCLFEVWYRKWELATIIKSPDGRVIEVDVQNPAHVAAIARGLVVPEKISVPRVYRSYWMGPHKLVDEPSPYPHTFFPYVPFWGKKEDRTGVPYGAVRGMVYLQDNINSANAKIRWGMSSVVTTRTKGAYTGTDAQFREQAARVDADFVLDAAHMQQPGSRFEVKRDFQLTQEHYRLLEDARLGIERVSGLPAAFGGQRGTATSGVQESTQVEQATQALADMMDNFETGRTQVGELLLAMIISDLGTQEKTVVIRGTPPIPDKTVVLNQATVDPATGLQMRTNDVLRTRLKVALSDVPSTSSFRAQQLAALSEAYKAMPQNLQVAVLPHLLALTDVPNKDKIIEAVTQAAGTQTEEQIQARIDQAVQQALKDSMHDLKDRELTGKLLKMAAEVKKVNADAGAKFMEMLFAAMQAGELITAVPQIGPVADALIEQAPGREQVNGPAFNMPQVPGQGELHTKPVNDPRIGVGFTPGAPGAQASAEPGAQPMSQGDTTPLTPAKPMHPATGFQGPNHGMTTLRPDSQGVNQ